MTKPVVCEEDGATVHRLHPVLEVGGRRGVQIEAAQQDPIIVGPSIPGVLFYCHAQAAEDTSCNPSQKKIKSIDHEDKS